MFDLLLGDPSMIIAQETAMLKAKKEFQKIEQAIRQALTGKHRKTQIKQNTEIKNTNG